MYSFLIFLFLLLLMVYAFTVVEKTGKIILGSFAVIFIILALGFPKIRIYLDIIALIAGIVCYIYLINAGYAYNIRVFRHKKPHDKV
jgi:hypothetical protein